MAIEAHAKLPSSLGRVLFGMEDGLVTALGTVLGVSAATNDARIILIAGIVATFAEAISMFFGSFLSSQSKAELYERVLREEKIERVKEPEKEKRELERFYKKMGFDKKTVALLTDKTMKNEKLFLNVMMREEFGMKADGAENPWRVAVVYLAATFIGLIAIIPFLFLPVYTANLVAVALVMLTLFAGGALKTRYTRTNWLQSGLQMMAIGMLAAIVGYVAGSILGARLA